MVFCARNLNTEHAAGPFSSDKTLRSIVAAQRWPVFRKSRCVCVRTQGVILITTICLYCILIPIGIFNYPDQSSTSHSRAFCFKKPHDMSSPCGVRTNTRGGVCSDASSVAAHSISSFFFRPRDIRPASTAENSRFRRIGCLGRSSRGMIDCPCQPQPSRPGVPPVSLDKCDYT